MLYTPARSVFAEVHLALQRAEELEAPRVALSDEMRWELIVSILLLPLCVLDLKQEFSPIVEASDAARHGRAYTYVTPSLAQQWSQVASHRGDALLLQDMYGYATPDAKHTHLVKACLPLHQHYWHEIPRPGFFCNIIIEEFEGMLWSLESRAKRGEVNKRAVNLGDNSSAIGAYVKGRSSVRHINSRCRRACAS
jgi:hypothetical protein